MVESLLTGGSANGRIRALPASVRALPEAVRAVLAEHEAAIQSGARAEINAANVARQQAEKMAADERSAREESENRLQEQTRLRGEAEAKLIKERAAREAADQKAIEADARATQIREMYAGECEKLEASEKRERDLHTQLMRSQSESRQYKDEVSRLKREKPVIKPVSYSVNVSRRDEKGRALAFEIIPRS